VSSNAFCCRSGKSIVATSRNTISRLGVARPDSIKLRCRRVVRAARARISREQRCRSSEVAESCVELLESLSVALAGGLHVMDERAV